MRHSLLLLFTYSILTLSVSHAASNQDILNRLDDLEYDQQMRENQRRAEQQVMPIPAPSPTPRSNTFQLNFVKEVKTYPDRFRFIERVNPFDYYLALPVKRWPDGRLSLITILLSDEVLEVGNVKYSYIVSGATLDCKSKSVKISDGDAYSPSGSVVSSVQGRRIAYDRSTKIWSKIDSLYCQ